MSTTNERNQRTELVIILSSVVALLVLYFVIPLDGNGWIVGLVILLAVLVGLVPYALWWARSILRSSRPVVRALEGLLVLLTVLMVGFASVYYTMQHHGPENFQDMNTKIDALYFTVTTLATVGFGDITAITQGARVIVTVQMLFDLVFIGVVIRTLAFAVSSHPGGPELSRRRQESNPPDGDHPSHSF